MIVGAAQHAIHLGTANREMCRLREMITFEHEGQTGRKRENERERVVLLSILTEF